MEILLLSPLPPPAGGMATWTKGYIDSKHAKVNKVNLVNTSVTGNRVMNLKKKSILGEINRTINIIKKTKKILKSNNFDIVHINTACSKLGMIRDLVCLSIAKNYNIKIIVHCHCDTSYMVKGKISEFIFKKICDNSDVLFSLNNASYNHIKKLIGKESIIVPNFIKSSILEEKNTIKVSTDIKNILYVGHITKSKGCDDIIDIAKQMPDKIFKMIGYISDEIKEIQTTKNVKYLGELTHEQVLQQMREHDLLLFPTHTEGFPNVVLEAMACGMPIISTDVGAIPDMIENNGGIVVKPKDKKSIKSSINKLEDRNLRLKMSDWNIKKVESNYTIDKVMDMIFSEYRNIIEED